MSKLQHRAIAFDPGYSTGVCEFTYADDQPMEVLRTWVIPDGIQGFIEWYLAEGEYVLDLCDRVIYEDFEIDGTITGSWASEVIGALKLATGNAVLGQRRQDKWGVIGYPNRLKTTEERETYRFNWLRGKGFEGLSSHELDAITHALVYLKRMEHIPTIRAYYVREFQE